MTNYAFFGTEKNVKAAYDALHRLEETDRSTEDEPDSFLGDSHWLGYVVIDILKKKWNSMDCRGTFSVVEIAEVDGTHRLFLDAESAWAPCYELWERFAKKFRLSLNYFAEESGACLYEKSTPDGIYTENFYLYDDNDGSSYFDTLEELIAEKGEKYGLKKGMSFEEVEARLNKRDDCYVFRVEDKTPR